MIVAGIDIGNTTTEIVVAEVSERGAGAGASPLDPLIARRALTAGVKGSEASLRGAARLLASMEAATGRRAELLLAAPMHPVVTIAAVLPGPPAPSAPLRRLDASTRGASSGTPAGEGFTAGAHVTLSALASGPLPEGPLVVSVPVEVDFEDAASAIAAAQQAGVPLTGALVAGDDAVLIANRIPHPIPIADEVDVSGVRPGELVALEVAAIGRRLEVLSDPVALAGTFALDPRETREVSPVALALADERAAALARARPDANDMGRRLGWLEVDSGSAEPDRRIPLSSDLAGELLNVRPGSIRRACLPAGSELGRDLLAVADRIRDAFAVDLQAVRLGSHARSGTVKLDEVPLSVLTEAGHGSSDAVMSEAFGRPVLVVAGEAEAAAAGALTTPGAPPQAAVCDLGGGTIDVVWGEQRLTAAGAGELLTVAIARALTLQRRSAEHVKRHESFRAERSGLLHHEDGDRTFADRPVPPAALGSLCYMGRRGPVPFTDRLAPEEWRSLRLAVKHHVIAANVHRCLAWLDGVPSALLLCGGAALDAEAARIVGEGLRSTGVAVGRANVAGRYGPRYGVALGLIILWHAGARLTQSGDSSR